jgi:2,4-dienoyl-CoA reductase-like NADH-dependent reductase (Old Yellow Enzyme family)
VAARETLVPLLEERFRRRLQRPGAQPLPRPTVASGRITTLDELHTVVAAGRADLCVLDPG